MVLDFYADGESFFDLKCGSSCIERSNFATNTTLKRLTLTLWVDESSVVDEGIEQIANALKTNQELQSLNIGRGLMTNVGRRKLLESLRDNASLVTLDTVLEPGLSDSDDDLDDDELLRLQGGIEGRELQSKIDRHMKLNRCWKNLNMEEHRPTPAYMDWNKLIMEEHRLTPISTKIYPDVLEVLAKKPLLLYKFIREKDHTLLFGSFYKIRSSTFRSNRRRSERLLKKRRLTAPGNSYVD